MFRIVTALLLFTGFNSFAEPTKTETSNWLIKTFPNQMVVDRASISTSNCYIQLTIHDMCNPNSADYYPSVLLYTFVWSNIIEVYSSNTNVEIRGDITKTCHEDTKVTRLKIPVSSSIYAKRAVSAMNHMVKLCRNKEPF